MRSDMDKVIVERPRYGSRDKLARKGYRKQWQQVVPEDWPRREGIYELKGRTKSLNEHLGPLRRFLDKQVGRPWNNVFAEICEHLRLDSAVQSHVRDHLTDIVAIDVVEVDGELYYNSRWGPGYPLEARRWLKLYVCPRTGYLRRIKPRRSRPVNRVNESASRQFHRLNGAWYDVRLCKLPYDLDGCWDAVLEKPLRRCDPAALKARYGCEAYALSKRPLNAVETRALLKRLRKTK